MAISPGFDKRLFTARLASSGSGNAMHGRVIDGQLRVAFGGMTNLNMPSYTRNGVQPLPGWGQQDAYLAIAKPASEQAQAPTWSYEPSKVDGDLPVQMSVDGDFIRIAQQPLGEHAGVSVGLAGAVQLRDVNKLPNALSVRFTEKRNGTRINLGPMAKAPKSAQMRQWLALTFEPTAKSGALSFTRTNQFESVLNVKRDKRSGHFLVREGTQWFVRQASLIEEPFFAPASDGDDGMWAPIDLKELSQGSELPNVLNEGDDGRLSFVAKNFNDITAVGILIGNDWGKFNRGLVGMENVSFSLAIDAQDDPSPVAQMTVSENTVELYDEVSFDASDSHDNGQPLSFIQWVLGTDGRTAGPQVSHRFSVAGRHDVQLTVWDENGATSQVLESIDVTLPGVAVAPGQQMVAAFGGNIAGRYSFPRSAVEGKHFVPLNLDKPMFSMRGNPLLGAYFSPTTGKRVFGDTSMSNTGTKTQPIKRFNAMTQDNGAVLVVAIGQDQFMAAPSINGADLSQGSLFAGGIKGGQIHWVIQTPNGWRISAEPAPLSGGNAQQNVTDISWLAYDPSDIAGKLLPAGKAVNEQADHVTAVGIAFMIGMRSDRKTGKLTHGKGKFNWSSIAAVGRAR